MLTAAIDIPWMPKQRIREAPEERLHIGAWLARLDRKPSEVAKKIGIGESYLSLLISGEKTNPAARLMLKLSNELGISVNALYTRPPERDVTDRVHQLRPDQLEALGSLLDDIKKGPGPR